MLNSKIEILTEDEAIIFGMIYDILEEKLHISVASDDKQIKLLYVGDVVKCIVFSDSVGISFEANVSNRIPGQIPIYELSGIRNLTEIQRRQDVRVDCTMKVLYSTDERLLKLEKPRLESLELSNIKSFFNEGTLGDLSGGGLRCITISKIDSREVLFLLNLEEDSLLVRGTIVHDSIKLTSRASFYSYGVKFIDISEREKDRIIKFLFLLMRRNRLQ